MVGPRLELLSTTTSELNIPSMHDSKYNEHIDRRKHTAILFIASMV